MPQHNFAKQADGSIMCTWCAADPADNKPGCQDALGAMQAAQQSAAGQQSSQRAKPAQSASGPARAVQPVKGPGACKRTNCPCTGKSDAKYPYCCRSCAKGTACTQNFHAGSQAQAPSQGQSQPAQAPPSGGPVLSKAPGSCARPQCPCTGKLEAKMDYCCKMCAGGVACAADYHGGQQAPPPVVPAVVQPVSVKGPGSCIRPDCLCTGKLEAKFDYCCRTCASGKACPKNYHSVVQPTPQVGQPQAPTVKGQGSCKRPNCPCTGKSDAAHDFCCRKCAGGVVCAKNFHTTVQAASQTAPAKKGAGSCSRSNCPCTGKLEAKHDYCCRTCSGGTPCSSNYHASVAPNNPAAPPPRPGGVCASPGCACTGKKDPSRPHCCRTCAQGTPCQVDYHGKAFQWPGQTPLGGAKTLVMYHGTSWDNAQNIQANGFRASTGGCLGAGVYVAELDKATRYANNVSRHGGKGGIGLVKCLVSYQNPKLVSGDDQMWQSQGYDACHTTNTSANPLPEWCLLSPSQVQVIQIKKL